MGAGSITGGDVTIWSGSANAVWGPDTDSTVGFYVTAGVGLDYLQGRITDTGLVYYPPICDPWFWWCIPGGVGPGTFVVFKQGHDRLQLERGSRSDLRTVERLADLHRGPVQNGGDGPPSYGVHPDRRRIPLVEVGT